MANFTQYALSVGNSRPGRVGNAGYDQDRERLIDANRGNMYASNPQTLYGQDASGRWHIVERFENLK